MQVEYIYAPNLMLYIMCNVYNVMLSSPISCPFLHSQQFSKQATNGQTIQCKWRPDIIIQPTIPASINDLRSWGVHPIPSQHEIHPYFGTHLSMSLMTSWPWKNVFHFVAYVPVYSCEAGWVGWVEGRASPQQQRLLLRPYQLDLMFLGSGGSVFPDGQKKIKIWKFNRYYMTHYV